MAGANVVRLTDYLGLAELRRAFGGTVPQIIFIDVMSNEPKALTLMSEISKSDKSINLMALLAGNDAQLILKCLRQGAAEFLPEPFDSAQLELALQKIARNIPKDKERNGEQAKVLCVMPVKGACGGSTCATNLAFHSKRTGSSRVLLADMDPLTGTISFLLKVKSPFSFLDALARAAEGLDADLWKTIIATRQGVDVLLAPDALFEGAGDLRDASAIVEYTRQNYDTVVLDAPGPYGEWNLGLARLSDEVVLVTTNELPALQAAQRALAYLEANKIGRWKTKVVVNRYDRDVGLNRDVIGTALHTDVFHVIPSDADALQKALLEGKAVASTTSLGRSFITLSDMLTGRQKKESSKNGSSLGSLLSLFSRTSST